MPAYKDEQHNTWYCQFYYEDWQGNKKKKKKRGFRTKKEAQEWENSFKVTSNADMEMTLGAFVEVYFQDKRGELKQRSIRNKRYMIDTHIVPYFEKKPMNSIKAADLIQWQNAIRAKGYSETYLRMIQNQMTALFTHAYKIYNLKDNPCKKVKKMGKSDADKLDFWTEEEYEKFISSIDENDRYHLIFEMLFWTGMREGELLALTPADIDMRNNQIHITKTYFRMNGEDIITTPKTDNSVRTIDIPEFLKQDIKAYLNRCYEIPDHERIFPIVAEAIQHKLKNQAKKAGVKKIRVHDIRHSHVAYLIHQGVQPLIIKERLGHRDIRITLNTYGHLYPNQQRQVAEMLNLKKQEKSPDSGNCQDL